MPNYWVSWEADPAHGEFEWHGPWWITGYIHDDHATVCAAVRGESEEHAMRAIVMAHDSQPHDIVWRFCNEQSEDWNPLHNDTGRFPVAAWMRWPMDHEQNHALIAARKDMR